MGDDIKRFTDSGIEIKAVYSQSTVNGQPLNRIARRVSVHARHST